MGKEWKIFSGDEFSIDLQTGMSPVWVKKGSKPKCPSHNWGGKVKIIGALNNKTGKVMTLACRKVNQFTFLDFLKKLLRYHKRVFLVVDNASWHKTKMIDNYLKEHSKRIQMEFFPTYCPEKNPVEQCWRAVKNDLLTCRLFLSVPSMEDHVKDYFKNRYFLNLKLERFLCP